MIDLHCHLLPGIDDGPETLDQALELARAAVSDGITHSVLTSHVHPERYPNQRSNLEAAAAAFSEELAKAEIPLTVRTGCEARLCPELIDLVADNQIPFLGKVAGFHILLLEFPHQMVPIGSIQFISSLLRMRIRPLIAHPERNKAIMANPERVREFTDAGCWLQITAGSLVGRFGEAAKDVAMRLVGEGHTCVIATDSHDLKNRPPLLKEGYEALRSKFGDTVADTIAKTRPAQIWGAGAV